MLLPVQIQSILYHFMMGWMYALLFSFLVTFIKYIGYKVIKALIEILFHLLYTSLMFYGLYHINGGVTNAYLIAIFVVGILIYQAFYFSVFLESFISIKRILRPIRKNIKVVKNKILAIMEVPKKMKKRRKANVNKRKRAKKERKSKKKKASNQDIL